MTKIVAVADLHGYLPEIEPCDLLIIAGDICPNFAGSHDKDSFRQAAWLDKSFREWLDRIPAKQVIAIWGNHDFVGQHRGLIPKNLRWTLLQDNQVELNGLKIYGTPWTPTFFDWAFMDSEENLDRRWKQVPSELDILISHGPPYGYCDKPQASLPRCGSKAMLSAVSGKNPKLLICGHIHGGRGDATLPSGGAIKNVAFVDEAYKPRHIDAAFEVESE